MLNPHDHICFLQELASGKMRRNQIEFPYFILFYIFYGKTIGFSMVFRGALGLKTILNPWDPSGSQWQVPAESDQRCSWAGTLRSGPCQGLGSWILMDDRRTGAAPWINGWHWNPRNLVEQINVSNIFIWIKVDIQISIIYLYHKSEHDGDRLDYQSVIVIDDLYNNPILDSQFIGHR